MTCMHSNFHPSTQAYRLVSLHAMALRKSLTNNGLHSLLKLMDTNLLTRASLEAPLEQ